VTGSVNGAEGRSGERDREGRSGGRSDAPEAKIVTIIERLSGALEHLLREEAQDWGLTPVQIRILVHLREHGPRLRRVGRIAREFDLSPATVSRAVGTLVDKGYVRKEASQRDARVVILELTPEGEGLSEELADWAEVVRERIAVYPEEVKDVLFQILTRLVTSLQQAGAISVVRMCTTCRFFGEEEGSGPGLTHRCRLLDIPLPPDRLRVDCPEHEPAQEDQVSSHEPEIASSTIGRAASELPENS